MTRYRPPLPSARSLGVALTLALALASPTRATTVGEASVDDPFAEGSRCPSLQIYSYGSYIFHAPSKWHQVFWPGTDDRWLSLCGTSGYAALVDDFPIEEGPEKAALARFLTEHYDPEAPPETPLARLRWAERIYRVRGRDARFWTRFLRLVAWRAEQAGDDATATTYRTRALAVMEERLAAVEPSLEKIELLFMTGEYLRRAGDHASARARWERAGKVAFTDDEGNEHVGARYFDGLIEERLELLPPAPDQGGDAGSSPGPADAPAPSPDAADPGEAGWLAP